MTFSTKQFGPPIEATTASEIKPVPVHDTNECTSRLMLEWGRCGRGGCLEESAESAPFDLDPQEMREAEPYDPENGSEWWHGGCKTKIEGRSDRWPAGGESCLTNCGKSVCLGCF